MNKRLLTLLLIGMVSISLVACTDDGTQSNNNIQEEQQSSNEEEANEKVIESIKHGKLLDVNINEDVLVIKAKIEPSLNNKLTISQNGFNIEDIIKKQGGDKFKEIQYWAVSDMSDGSESKVISFTVNEDLIKNIKEGNIVGNQIVDNSEDVWILPSLQE